MVDEIREVHNHDSQEYNGANSMWIAVVMLIAGLFIVLVLFGGGVFSRNMNGNNPDVDIRANIPASNRGGNGGSSFPQ